MMVDVGCGGAYQPAIPELQQDNTAAKTADIKYKFFTKNVKEECQRSIMAVCDISGLINVVMFTLLMSVV